MARGMRWTFLELCTDPAGLMLAASSPPDGGIGLYTPKDGKINGWELRQDFSHASRVGEVVYVDWVHMAPSYRTLSRSGQTDESGAVPVGRTSGTPYGYGKVDADTNLLAERCGGMAREQSKRQAYSSIENPKDSFLFVLTSTIRPSKYPGVRAVVLDHWAYGGPYCMPTWIITNAPRIVLSASLGQGAPPHRRVTFKGQGGSYAMNQEVWYTSEVAEHPSGPCSTWAAA